MVLALPARSDDARGFVVRHRGDHSYFVGVRGFCAMWTHAIAKAHRFASAEDAWTTAYICCVTTPPADLEVVPAGEGISV